MNRRMNYSMYLIFQHPLERYASIGMYNIVQQSEDNIMFPYYGGQRRPLQRKWIRIAMLIIVLLIALYFSARLTFSKIIEAKMQPPYIPFSDDSFIGQLAVFKTDTNLKWKVQVSAYDSSGNLVASPHSYLEPCDHWELEANIISIQPWLALGVPSGWYMLTNLEGSHCYDQHGKPTTTLVNIPIDGSTAPIMQDGGFLRSVKSMIVASASIQPDGITYNVFITPTTLSLTPTG